MDTEIFICDSQCTVTAATGNSISCSTGAFLNEYSYNDDLQKHWESGNGADSVLPPEIISSTPKSGHEASNVFDLDGDTYFKAAVADDCYIGIDAGDNYKFYLNRVSFMPNRSNINDVDKAAHSRLEWSDDNVTWNLLHTFGMLRFGHNMW